MPATEVIDLDKIFGGTKKVKLGGKIYTLPGQIPVPLYLLVKERQKARAEAIEAGEETGDADVIEEIHRQVLELFQIHHPELKVLPVGIGQLFDVIPVIYGAEGGAEGADEPEEAPPPTRTRARTGSGNSTRSRKSSRRRS